MSETNKGEAVDLVSGSAVRDAYDVGRRQIQAVDPSRDQDWTGTALVIPCDCKAVPWPERKGDRPRFLVARPEFYDVADFIRYVNDFKDGCTRIFANVRWNAMTAILDYHETGVGGDPEEPMPRHGDHVARFQARHSEEWDAWMGSSEKQMSQVDFAEFVEDNYLDIVDPEPEHMLRVATGLHATNNATFRSAHNMANGQVNVSFDEQIDGRVAGGDLEIPQTFSVGLRPFEGCSRFPIECRFRYRLREGQLKMWYKCLRTQPIIDQAFDAILDRVRDESGIEPLSGAP